LVFREDLLDPLERLIRRRLRVIPPVIDISDEGTLLIP